MTKVVLDLNPSTLVDLSAILPLGFIVAYYILGVIVTILPQSIRFTRWFASPGVGNRKEELVLVSRERDWKSSTLFVIAAGQAGSILIAFLAKAVEGEGTRELMLVALTGVGWIYATLSPLFDPPLTPPYLLLIFYTVHFIISIITSLHYLLHPHSTSQLVSLAFNIISTSILISIVFTLPITARNRSAARLESFDSKELSSEEQAKKEPVYDSPEQYCSLFSWTTFAWVGPLIDRKVERLEYYHIWKLTDNLRAEGVSASARETECAGLIARVFSNNSLDIILSLVLGLLSSLLSYSAPYFLQRILQSLTPPSSAASRQSAYIYAILALSAQVIKAEVDLQQLWHERRTIVRTRSELMGEVYEKALRRRNEVKKGSSVGKIVQLMSSDAMRIANQLMSLSSFFTAPVELVIGITFLYSLLGWSALAGLSVMLFALPANHYLVKRRIIIYKSVLSSRDKRMDVLNEFISSIRFVKYSGSESSWLGKVGVAREDELKWLLATRLNNLAINAIWNATPDLISLLAFVVYTKFLGQELDVATAFTAIALFALIRSPMNSLPTQVTGLLQTYVSVKRLEDFLAEEEVPDWVSGLKNDESIVESRIAIDQGSFCYASTSTPRSDTPAATETTPLLTPPATLPTATESTPLLALASTTAPASIGTVTPVEVAFELRDIDVEFPLGKLSLIVGPTASGKSTLCLALLGEMNVLSGRVSLPKGNAYDETTGLYNGVAYVSQIPWLENETIRNNILFGSIFEQERYDEVVRVCGLQKDIEMFESGDETEIGEKGITISGGQRSRVGLARAVYCRAATVIIDDALSALDMGTARFVYENCFRGEIMRGRTVILVTHHVALCLPSASYLVRLSSGRVAYSGPATDSAVVADTLVQEAKEEIEDEKQGEITKVDAIGRLTNESMANTPRASSPTLAPSVPSKDVANGKGQLVLEEKRATGRVKGTVYKKYLSAAGWGMWVIIFGLVLGGRGFRVLDRYWFKIWGESYRSSESFTLVRTFSSPLFTTSFPSLPSASDNVNPYLIVYGLLCLGNLVLLVVVILAGYSASFRASRILFTTTLERIARAPFRYWDTTPSGRVLNRFSGDFQIVDSSLTDQVRIVLTQAFSFVVNLIVILIVAPTFLPFAIAIVVVYVMLSASYVRCSRDLRRLESNARSPIYSGFSETLAGIITCRAFGSERRFLTKLHDRIDLMLSAHYASAMINRYLLWRFDCIGAIAVFITTVISLRSSHSAGTTALAITSAQGLCSSIYWLCRFVSALEVDLNAVERITELLETPQEPSTLTLSEGGKSLPAIWPTDTAGISVKNLTLAYSPSLPPVLHNVSFDLLPREKVALVGRTGSGKSTLASALFRFVEFEGSITIDALSLSTLPLAYRSRLSLIAQDATLWNGTVRSNLDAFGEYTDAECEEVLRRVQMDVRGDEDNGALLIDVTTKVKGSGPARGRRGVRLETEVSQGGLNFSAGQRQLLAMARALLKKSKIIVMDEATASVDFETDAAIQHTIREEFADSLVITIAHRLRTIIDYDRILVLDQGRLIEFDTPKNLLLNPDGAFRKMCESAADWEGLKASAGI